MMFVLIAGKEVMGHPGLLVGEGPSLGSRSSLGTTEPGRAGWASVCWKKKGKSNPVSSVLYAPLPLACTLSPGCPTSLNATISASGNSRAVPKIADCVLGCVLLPGRNSFNPLPSHIAVKPPRSQALREKGPSNRAINSTNNTIKP